jgi:hypothetical protein
MSCPSRRRMLTSEWPLEVKKWHIERDPRLDEQLQSIEYDFETRQEILFPSLAKEVVRSKQDPFYVHFILDQSDEVLQAYTYTVDAEYFAARDSGPTRRRTAVIVTSQSWETPVIIGRRSGNPKDMFGAWKGAREWNDKLTVERHDPFDDEDSCGDCATAEEPSAMSSPDSMPQPEHQLTDYEGLFSRSQCPTGIATHRFTDNGESDEDDDESMDDDAENPSDIEEAAHSDTRSHKRRAGKTGLDEIITGLKFGRRYKKPKIAKPTASPTQAVTSAVSQSTDAPVDQQRRSSSTLVHVPPQPRPDTITESPRIPDTAVTAAPSPPLQATPAENPSAVVDPEPAETNPVTLIPDPQDTGSTNTISTGRAIPTAAPLKFEEIGGNAADAQAKSPVPVRSATPKVKTENPLGSTENPVTIDDDEDDDIQIVAWSTASVAAPAKFCHPNFGSNQAKVGGKPKQEQHSSQTPTADAQNARSADLGRVWVEFEGTDRIKRFHMCDSLAKLLSHAKAAELVHEGQDQVCYIFRLENGKEVRVASNDEDDFLVLIKAIKRDLLASVRQGGGGDYTVQVRIG